MSRPSGNPIRPLAIGEVALRVSDLARSTEFYRDILGFELIRVFPDRIAFLKVAEGVEGHTQVIGLFRSEQQAGGAPFGRSTLHHFAIEISIGEHERVLRHLTEHDLEASTATHEWVGWRSIYVSDPDGNTVEFVSYDPDLPRSGA